MCLEYIRYARQRIFYGFHQLAPEPEVGPRLLSVLDGHLQCRLRPGVGGNRGGASIPRRGVQSDPAAPGQNIRVCYR